MYRQAALSLQELQLSIDGRVAFYRKIFGIKAYGAASLSGRDGHPGNRQGARYKFHDNLLPDKKLGESVCISPACKSLWMRLGSPGYTLMLVKKLLLEWGMVWSLFVEADKP